MSSGVTKPLYPPGTWVIQRENKTGTLVKGNIVQVTKVDDKYMYTDDGKRYRNISGISPDTEHYSAILNLDLDG